MSCGVQFSTDLHDANQCIAPTLNDSHIVRIAESGDDVFNLTLSGHSMKGVGVVALDDRGGMLLAAFKGYDEHAASPP
jgi:hypothetical protein